MSSLNIVTPETRFDWVNLLPLARIMLLVSGIYPQINLMTHLLRIFPEKAKMPSRVERGGKATKAVSIVDVSSALCYSKLIAWPF